MAKPGSQNVTTKNRCVHFSLGLDPMRVSTCLSCAISYNELKRSSKEQRCVLK